MQSAPPHRGSFFLRRGRRSIAGQTYLITFTTYSRRPLFAHFAVAVTACRATEDPRVWRSSNRLAWVLMPDHWHGLIRIGEDDSLSAVVQRLKANSASRVREEHPHIGPVWARGFHDRALRADEGFRDVARYVVRNPVAAGLVRRVGEYPFWNVAWL